MRQVSMCLNLFDDQRYHLQQLRSGKIKVRRPDESGDADATVEAMEVCKGTIYRLEELYRVLESKAAEEERLAKRREIVEGLFGAVILIGGLAPMMFITSAAGWQGDARLMACAAVPLVVLLLAAKQWGFAATAAAIYTLYVGGSTLFGA